MKRNANTPVFAMLSIPVIDAAKVALMRGAQRVVDKAKEKCPVKTGNLRDSIHAESVEQGKRIKIVADAMNEKSGIYYGKIVEFSPKINKPYLFPALEEERGQIMQDIRTAISEALSKGAKK